MTFDSWRGVSVLFGDNDENPQTGATWEWNGEWWSLRPGMTPGWRWESAMAFDSNRGVSVLFAGNRGSTVQLRDTWEWNGNVWVMRSNSGPNKRYSHAMAFDSIRNVVVLFGGSVHPTVPGQPYALNDIWEWDGIVWTYRGSGGPQNRDEHAMVFDDDRGVMVLFGGKAWTSNSWTLVGDTWEWDGTSWSLRSSTGPAPREGHTMAYDSERNVVVLFGGIDANDVAFGDTWEWDGTSWLLRTTSGIAARTGHMMSYDSEKQETVVVGGDLEPRPGSTFVGKLEVSTWTWNGQEWTQKVAYQLPDFVQAGVAYDPIRRETIACGTVNRYDEPHEGGTLTWNGNVWTQRAWGSPCLRRNGSMAFDVNRSVAVLYGGTDPTVNQSIPLTDTWEWNGQFWNLISEGPSPPCTSQLVYHSGRGTTMAYCGWFDDKESRYRGGIWEWNGLTWNQHLSEGPGYRLSHSLAYDESRNALVLYGGYSEFDVDCGLLGDTWEWDGQNWALREVEGPNPRHDAAMIYDSDRQIVVLYGGMWVDPGCECCNYNFDTWEWDGMSWTENSDTRPNWLTGQQIAYDSFRKVVVFPRPMTTSGKAYEYSCNEDDYTPVSDEVFPPCACYAPKNRYLSFVPPAPVLDSGPVAIRVTLTILPGPNDCPNVPDFSVAEGNVLWVGQEATTGSLPTGIFRLQSTPRFYDWTHSPNQSIHVSDCNIVPCATYRIDVVREADYPKGPFSEPLFLSTSSLWGDMVGMGSNSLPDGIVDFVDISAAVDRFRNWPTAPPGTWCDLGSENPTQGVNFNIDFSDISHVVDAFRGLIYPFSGPSAPNPCD